MATAMYTPTANTIVSFEKHPQKNETRSKDAGRPMFDDLEVIKIRQAADRQSTKVFPAHEVAEVDPDTGEDITYAMKYADQYKKFKAGNTQTVDGTPLDEAPFLTVSKRSELKALGVLTVESLASLDGQNLKNLGQGGRELKTQAQAYIDNASGSANVVRMASEIEHWKAEAARLEERLRNQGFNPDAGPSADDIVAQAAKEAAKDTAQGLQDMSDDELKDWIKEKTGQRPRGNPSHETLVQSALEIQQAG